MRICVYEAAQLDERAYRQGFKVRTALENGLKRFQRIVVQMNDGRQRDDLWRFSNLFASIVLQVNLAGREDLVETFEGRELTGKLSVADWSPRVVLALKPVEMYLATLHPR